MPADRIDSVVASIRNELAPARADGARILVDRIWPCGISKVAAKIDQWRQEIAPSAALRKWFGHDPARWAEFKRRYFAELKAQRTRM